MRAAGLESFKKLWGNLRIAPGINTTRAYTFKTAEYGRSFQREVETLADIRDLVD